MTRLAIKCIQNCIDYGGIVQFKSGVIYKLESYELSNAVLICYNLYAKENHLKSISGHWLLNFKHIKHTDVLKEL